MLGLAALGMHLACAQQDAGQTSEDASNGDAGEQPHIFAGKEHLDIYLDQHVADLMSVIDASDRLSLVYIFHSEILHDSHGQNWRILDEMFLKVLEELNGGYVNTYAIDCAAGHEEVDPKVNLEHLCSGREEFQPVFTLYKPPEIKINPYTGKEMPVQVVPFASNQVSDPDVKKWITDNVPDYTQRLMTREDASQFSAESDIKKVYLFSAKQKVPPIYKALSATFRNRLRFAFVNVEASVSAELAGDYGVEKWPTLLVENGAEDGESHAIFGGKMKLNELIDFVAPFALPEDQKKEERVISSKSQTTVNQQNDASGYMLLTAVSDIEDKLLPESEAALLLIAQKDGLEFLPILEEFSAKMGSFMNIALLVVDETANADLKREFKSSKLPQFRFYPNLKTGQDKRSASFEIVYPKSGSLDEVREAILEEVHSNYETDVKDVTEKVYYSIGAQNSRDGKITVLYIYEDGGVDFTYKALSTDPYLKDDFVFMALDGPSDSMKNDQTLPAVTGMLFIDEENPTPRIFSFQGMVEVHYREVHRTLLQMFPEKFEAFEEDMRVKLFKKQNPGQETHEARNPVPREFKELRGMKDFDDICKSHKACALAILPAITSIDYEADNFHQKLALL